jgi:hypothetical protein
VPVYNFMLTLFIWVVRWSDVKSDDSVRMASDGEPRGNIGMAFISHQARFAVPVCGARKPWWMGSVDARVNATSAWYDATGFQISRRKISDVGHVSFKQVWNSSV